MHSLLYSVIGPVFVRDFVFTPVQKTSLGYSFLRPYISFYIHDPAIYSPVHAFFLVAQISQNYSNKKKSVIYELFAPKS